MQSIAAQRHRVNRVIVFAQAHIADRLDLDRLADVACLSKYHFTRVFLAHLGQTPFEFMSRIRLERAARTLVSIRNEPITDVAMDCGFSSSQSFSRAFRLRFHTSPRSFRSGNQWSIESFRGDRILGASEGAFAGVQFETGWMCSAVRIETRPEYRVAYIRHIGPYFNVTRSITATFSALGRWAHVNGLWRETTATIGLCPDNARLTPARHCIYDACIPVPSGIREDNVVSIQTIPAGTYAVLKVKCSPAQIYRAWEWLATTWLPASGMTYDLQWPYEHFPVANGTMGRPETGVELCLRLKTG